MNALTHPLPVNPTPILLAIDIQQEYISKGRPYYLDGIEPALDNCHRVLDHARQNRWPVIHMRHLQDSHLFNEELPFSRFIEGFEPLAHEMVFTKHLFSCFSNAEFEALMDTTRHHPVYVMGFDAQMCCLSTVVDAMHRGLRLNFIGDASLGRATSLGDERQSYEWTKEILAVYADIVDTETVIGPASAYEDMPRQKVAARR